MKITLRIVILLAVLGILISYGCKKEEPYYPSKAIREDYSGTWDGKLTAFRNNKVITREGSIIFYFTPEGDQLNGILMLDEVYALTEIQLRNGIYYFQVLNSDTANPFCEHWNLSGFAELSSAQAMHVIITGKECGQLGKEWVNYEGDFTLANALPDSTRYFSFGGLHQQWQYQVWTLGGDSCDLTNEITTDDDGLFSGTTATTCNLPWGSMPFRWEVTPMHFSVLNNSGGSSVQYAFHIDQVLNLPYKYYPGNDTNIVTWLGIDSVIVPAGGFLCSKYFIERRLHTDSTYTIDKGILYLSNQFGLIRYQATLLNNSNDFLDQALVHKNF